MSLFNVFDVSGSAMSAQNVRLNTTASNLANANSVSSSVEQTYRARQPVFAAQLQQAVGKQQGESVGVKVLGVVESDKPLQIEYNPGHPMADENGYIYKPNVNVVEEMANMISASRSYQTNVQIADSAKQMLTRTLQLGKG
ncbi:MULTISPECIES: flagellar basal body rod protein FlgC [Pseudoalteromonas]|uniref:Flagellar basal-body rod protein FlgC n=1 Tax=Pseudoalteromonas ruthenica TaxID=151081 RepID=A0A0F4PVN9_9GAMM|nr:MULTISPECIES: flagellar basal body rod protein FlgC [Pseudoalteromonas]KJY97207.1 flagellar basal body rod protein FlgC [Pseudoalteromonas ruthenica]KJY99520.1 flagellar basal body rod protein FlgC [Pseudoalteromonas ruthenica]MCF2863441.1 flagellar basal body rod protein FlgC [Pseudoalteromonas sp. CNAT2-18]MCG7544883.1 flagellar basal body rod protein FlgC [Pseudoalteromonas sp. MM17-2]MCG7558394.1 flagellar basal body rod protein FlgC [Pseudoalteromonas sp. CNAT2-18.1]|tara:strand:- start:2127 stop:2549 length:423 start_codon:yes stop_codon:yes gene_type:complete